MRTLGAGYSQQHRPYAAAAVYDRPDEDADRELYQTVYSEKPARLQPRPQVCILTSLCWKNSRQRRGDGVCDVARWCGHLPPVRVDTIEDHIMHSEYAEVPRMW